MAKRSEVLEAVGAERAAHAAAARAGVEVAELSSLDHLRAAADLFVEVWGVRADLGPISPDMLRAFAHSGNYVAGARAGSALVGASVAFLANAGSGYKLHSHITGVTAAGLSKGVGFALKIHQRAWAIDRGLPVVSWTFDPLVRRNAYFNLTKLGATANRFLVNFYGEMADSLNAGDESDR
ncbi:MAG: GNAT family N-acetyltransferase, partial [Actinobacteria bacterium]|nr:GNAT family N-acetyltransferase [Actinomycetota bacterium]